MTTATQQQIRSALQQRYGQPRSFPRDVALRLLGITDVDMGDVYAVLYRTKEAADASTKANAEHWNVPSLGLVEVDGGWVGLLDLRPQIAELKATQDALAT